MYGINIPIAILTIIIRQIIDGYRRVEPSQVCPTPVPWIHGHPVIRLLVFCYFLIATAHFIMRRVGWIAEISISSILNILGKKRNPSFLDANPSDVNAPTATSSPWNMSSSSDTASSPWNLSSSGVPSDEDATSSRGLPAAGDARRRRRRSSAGGTSSSDVAEEDLSFTRTRSGKVYVLSPNQQTPKRKRKK